MFLCENADFFSLKVLYKWIPRLLQSALKAPKTQYHHLPKTFVVACVWSYFGRFLRFPLRILFSTVQQVDTSKGNQLLRAIILHHDCVLQAYQHKLNLKSIFHSDRWLLLLIAENSTAEHDILWRMVLFPNTIWLLSLVVCSNLAIDLNFRMMLFL